jgi:peptide subunit release factor RF-3
MYKKVNKKVKLEIANTNKPVLDNNNFKGIYYNDNDEQKYYEYGAHFPYRELCYRLEKIVITLNPDRKGKTMYEDWDGEKEGK